jgi:radical SAM protein with 4Fe4S-binding SPASM domain
VEFASRYNTLNSYPSFLIVEPTNRCNLKCPLCPTGQNLRTSRGTMTMKTFTRIVDQLHLYIRHMNLFYLGEPLLCTELPEMIKYAHKHNIRVSVSSNLNVLDETMAEQLIKSEMDYLIVSLDGTLPKTYATYRIGGDYDIVIKHIKLMIEKRKQLKSAYPRILIQFVVFSHNEAEVASVKKLAQSLGVDVFFRQGALGGKGQSPPLTKDRQLAEQWLTRDRKYQTEYDYFSEKPYIKSGACGYLWNVATVNWDGSLLPCCWIYDNEHSFGNIMEQDFKDIWNNVLYRSSRNLFSSKNALLSSGVSPKDTICYQCKMFRHAHNG